MRKTDVLFSIGVCMLSILLWAPRWSGPIDLRFDAGVYYVTGTSLAEGKGYRLLNEPGDVAAVQYPPALPAFVAAHQLVLGTSDPAVVGPWLRWSYFAMFTGYLLASYGVSRRYLRPAAAFAGTALAGCFLMSYYLSDLLFAEIPFALCTMLLILCNRRGDRPGWFAASGVLAAVAFLLRSAGIAVLAAWVAEALVRRRWRLLAARAAVAAIPFLAWQGYIGHVTSSPEYAQPAYPYQRAAYQYYNVPYAQNVMLTDPFRPEQGEVGGVAGLAKRAAWHTLVMPPRLGEVVSTKAEFWKWLFWDVESRLPGTRNRDQLIALDRVAGMWGYVPLTALGLLTVAGAIWLARRLEWFVPLYVAATVGIVALTPWPGQFARYLTPIAPLLALCLVLALVRLRRHARAQWNGSWRHAGTATLAAALTLAFTMEAYTLLRTLRTRPGAGLETYGDGGPGARLFYYDATWHAYAKALEWIGGDAAAGDVVAASIPHWAYLKTGLKTVMPPMESDVAKGQALLDSVPVRYLIVDAVADVDTARVYARPTVEAHADLWELVLVLHHLGPHRVGPTTTQVYRRVDESRPRGATTGPVIDVP